VESAASEAARSGLYHSHWPPRAASRAPSRRRRHTRVEPRGGDTGELGGHQSTPTWRGPPRGFHGANGRASGAAGGRTGCCGLGHFDDARVPRQQLETMRSEVPSLLYAMALRGAATVMPVAAEASAAAAIATPMPHPEFSALSGRCLAQGGLKRTTGFYVFYTCSGVGFYY
jgi:hypothetical protein